MNYFKAKSAGYSLFTKGELGMGLEFIDISREEERDRVRANGTTGRRRNPVSKRPQPVRREISQPIGYEHQRRLRQEGQTFSHAQTQRAGQAKPVRKRAYPETEIYTRKYNSQNRSRNYNHGRNRNMVRRPRPVDPKVQQEQMRRRKKRRQKALAARMTITLAIILVIIFAGFMFCKLILDFTREEEAQKTFNSYTPTVERKEVIKANETGKPVITEDFLTVNEYSRPGEKLGKVRNIFVHYTANPGTSAAQNRSYFENLGITGETSASAHFVIGYEGEIIQCIPLDEIAYAVIQRNYDSISIECCYLAEDGRFTDETYQSLLRLSAWLLKEYKLAPDDMRRHYDEGGKKCPLYYVEHEEAWEKFLSDLERYIMNDQV